MTPIHDRVIIKPDDKEERTQGGIILTDGQIERPSSGVIISVGRNKDGMPLKGIEVGMRVRFNKHAGTEFDHEGVTYQVIRYDELYIEIDESEKVEGVEWFSDY